MGSATVETLTVEQARVELAHIIAEIGELADARARSDADLLTVEQEHRLRRAENLVWLLDRR
ncbi:hypothetical protein [Agilicoccus flavus]|uniref:hypothetical protein n=1 Tax=Agilicoccus flavus TaxID=2775968 RepID=UPI001CF606C5|nr:hypothetical protein [Agilicoccus flavus]